MDFKTFRAGLRGGMSNDGNSTYKEMVGRERTPISGNADIATMNALIEKYGNMKEEDVLRVLIEEVNREKSMGSFNINNLTAFYRTIAPYLGNNERVKMRGIIEALKES